MSNILEKTLNKIHDKICEGFLWISYLGKTQLWLASFLGALYFVSLLLLSLFTLVLAVGFGYLVVLGGFSIVAAIVFLYQAMGAVFFYIILFLIAIFFMTLFTKSLLKSEIERGD